ncbi:MAG TPA: (2Fe-2S)-binding protein [Chloroflexota bacterium]|jgi:aerobic-type carbon monoxide dehydrogenase small subunit (CoxS/CutS family)
MLELRINGTSYAVDADADRALLGVLRDDLGLTGAKYGCGEGQCGACMVLVDDQPLPACITTVGAAVGRDLVTVEGLAVGGRLHPMQQAFLDQEAFQCGYCTPGMLVAGVGLLRRNAMPSSAAIVSALQPNLCRCGVYQRIVCAVQQAAKAMRANDEGATAE